MIKLHTSKTFSVSSFADFDKISGTLTLISPTSNEYILFSEYPFLSKLFLSADVNWNWKYYITYKDGTLKN